MSQWDKLLSRVVHLEPDIRFEELQKILEKNGYKMYAPSGGSSHCTFRKPGCRPITIPKHKPVKKTYVRLVKEIVESEGYYLENS